IARCRNATSSVAFQSLIEDIFEKGPKPLIYSRVPIEQVGMQPTNLKTDLILSSIELVHAEGLLQYRFSSLSEAADRYYRARDRAKAFQAEYNALRQSLFHELKKREEILNAVESDRVRYDDPERLKRYGDLILANLANARREGDKVLVIDYYDPSQPLVAIGIDENRPLQQAASDYFNRYQKARRALIAIDERQQI